MHPYILVSGGWVRLLGEMVSTWDLNWERKGVGILSESGESKENGAHSGVFGIRLWATWVYRHHS